MRADQTFLRRNEGVSAKFSQCPCPGANPVLAPAHSPLPPELGPSYANPGKRCEAKASVKLSAFSILRTPDY